MGRKEREVVLRSELAQRSQKRGGVCAARECDQEAVAFAQQVVLVEKALDVGAG